MTASASEWLYAVRSGIGGLAASLVTVAACSAFVLGAGTIGPWGAHESKPRVEKVVTPRQVRTASDGRASRAAAKATERRRPERVAPARARVIPARGRLAVPQTGPSGAGDVPATPAPRPVTGGDAKPTRATPPAQTVEPIAPLAGTRLTLPALPTLPAPAVPSVALPTVGVPAVTVAPVAVPSVTVPSLP